MKGCSHAFFPNDAFVPLVSFSSFFFRQGTKLGGVSLSEPDTAEAFSVLGGLQTQKHFASPVTISYYDNANLRQLVASTMAQRIIFSRCFHFFVFQVVAGIYHNAPI